MECERWVLGECRTRGESKKERDGGVGVFPVSGLPHVTPCRHPVCQQREGEDRGGGREGEEKGKRGTL